MVVMERPIVSAREANSLREGFALGMRGAVEEAGVRIRLRCVLVRRWNSEVRFWRDIVVELGLGGVGEVAVVCGYLVICADEGFVESCGSY